MMFAGAARRALTSFRPARAVLAKAATAPASSAPLMELPTATVHRLCARFFAASGKRKTHSGAKKRFKITSKGRVKYSHQGKRHNASTKNRKRIRRLGEACYIKNTKVANTIKGMLRSI